jgi:hypothetical protein
MKTHLLGIVCKGLLLAAVPVLVEPALELIGEVRSPDSGEGAETARSLDIANDTNDDERRGLNDSDGLDNLTLVHLCAHMWRSEKAQTTKNEKNVLDPGRSRSRTTWVMPAL